MEPLQQVLDTIADGPGIKFATIVTDQGLALESSTGADPDSELLSSATCEIVGTADRIGRELHGGHCRSILLQLEQITMLVETLESGLFLMVGLDNTQDAVGIRYIVQRSLDQLRRQIQQPRSHRAG